MVTFHPRSWCQHEGLHKTRLGPLLSTPQRTHDSNCVLLPTHEPSLPFSNLNTMNSSRCSQDSFWSLPSPSCPLGSGVGRAEGSQLLPSLREQALPPDRRQEDGKVSPGPIHRKSRVLLGKLPYRFPPVLCTFHSPHSQIQFFPGTPPALRGVALGKPRCHCGCSIHWTFQFTLHLFI